MTKTEMRRWIADTMYLISQRIPDNADDADLMYLYSAISHHLLGEVTNWAREDALRD